jgi:hypothetical protein
MKESVCAAALLALASSPSLAGETYAPMAVFAPLDGKAYRAEWIDEAGKKTVDVATYEMILGGRALQSTHRIEGSSYGGRTVFFYDEAAHAYVFHYFTTGGFHTAGSAELKDGVLTSSETVNGHAEIAAVRARSTFKPDEIRVDVIYVGKDGSETATPSRSYRPIADPGPLFAD